MSPARPAIRDSLTKIPLLPLSSPELPRMSALFSPMQLAHAGRKASSARPWDGGQLIPVSEGGWQTVAPSALPHKEGEAAPLALDATGLKRIREAFVEAAKRAER